MPTDSAAGNGRLAARPPPLLERIREGDLAPLVAVLEGMLRAYAARLLNAPADDPGVLDLVSNTWAQALRHRQGFYRLPGGGDRGPADDESVGRCFRVWLRLTLYHEFCDQRQQAKREAPAGLNGHAPAPGEEGRAEGRWRLAEVGRLVEGLLEGLGPLERAVVCLHYRGGFTHAEIAYLVGMTRQQVSHRFERALAQLAARYREHADAR